MQMTSLLLLAIVTAGISCVAPYKILFFMAFGSKSHRNAFDPVAEELTKRGNEVTFLTTVKAAKEIPGVTEIPLVQSRIALENTNISFFKGPMGDDKESFTTITETVEQLCHLTYEDPEVQKMLKNPGAFNYDVVIVDAIFNEIGLALGNYLGSANIVFSPGCRFASTAWTMNIPHPISYLPTTFNEYTDRMSFWQRASNTFQQISFHVVRHHTIFPKLDEIIAEFIPTAPTISELENQVSFFISNTHPAINPPMPSMPYSIEVGCISCKPAKPLSKDLEDFMSSAADVGVIYFSLGTMAKGELMPLDMRAKIIEAFAQLPQKILWKYDGNIINLPKNIKLTKWAPQQDLLGHEKLRLFITHGGLFSISESVYHRCPVLGFPLSADQWGNIAMATQRGFAEFLDFRIFTTEELLHKIKLMLMNDRYQTAADHYSAILRDYSQPPVAKAVYWIEYVARHKGAAHLKSAAENLNFFQYFLLDVIGAILLVVSSVLAIIYLVLRKACQTFCRNQTTSTKQKMN